MISTQMQKEVVMFDCLKGEVSVYTSIHGCLIVIVDLQLQKTESTKQHIVCRCQLLATCIH